MSLQPQILPAIVRLAATVTTVVFLVSAPRAVAAKTLYVDGQSGSDATSYANNGPSSPWRTIGRAAWGSTNRAAPNAAEAARAGDVVLVAAGTYSAPGSNSRNQPLYNPVNEGTAGNPITFRAVSTVALTLTSGDGSLIGSFDRDYITWEGFSIHEAAAPSHPDTGPVTIWLCDGCVVQNLDINGNGDGNGRDDNHTGIRIELSRNIVARNNRIQNVFSHANTNNGAGIMTYSSGGLTIEHNEIFNCGSGIFLKGGGTNANLQLYKIIRYNLIYDLDTNGSGIALHGGGTGTASQPGHVYQNLIINGGLAPIRLWMFDSVTLVDNPIHVKIVNNTIYGGGWSLRISNGTLLPDARDVFRNNIVVSPREYAIQSDSSAASLGDKNRFDAEHNLYFGFPTFAQVGNNYTFATWKSTFGQDSASPASLNVNPMFVNAGARDFRLQAGSPAATLGRDLLDLNRNGSTGDAIPAGAYVTGTEVIGRTTGPFTPPPPLPTAPAPPTNLRIIR